MINDFLKHLFPRFMIEKNLKLSYTFCLGGLAFTSFLLLIASGMLLLFYYTPSVENAYASIIFIEESVFGGKYIRNLHRLSSHFFLGLIFAHTIRVLLTGAFSARSYNWTIGFLLMCLAIIGAYTGYLLPMDQLAYWATQTGMELVRLLPFGDVLHNLLAPDGIGGSLTLLRFYALHIIVVPASVLILTTLHFYRIRKDRGVLPYL